VPRIEILEKEQMPSSLLRMTSDAVMTWSIAGE